MFKQTHRSAFVLTRYPLNCIIHLNDRRVRPPLARQPTPGLGNQFRMPAFRRLRFGLGLVPLDHKPLDAPHWRGGDSKNRRKLNAWRGGSSAAALPAPPVSSVPRHTMWMSHSCSWNDMAGTSTPYEPPGQRPPGGIRSHHSHSDHCADCPAPGGGPGRPRQAAPAGPGQRPRKAHRPDYGHQELNRPAGPETPPSAAVIARQLTHGEGRRTGQPFYRVRPAIEYWDPTARSADGGGGGQLPAAPASSVPPSPSPSTATGAVARTERARSWATSTTSRVSLASPELFFAATASPSMTRQ